MVENTVRKFLRHNHPQLNNLPYPVLAKVTKLHNEGEFVNLRILDKNRNIDSRYKEIPKVKTHYFKKGKNISLITKNPDNITSYDEFEVYMRYEEGDIVIVDFLYGDLSQPHIVGKEN